VCVISDCASTIHTQHTRHPLELARRVGAYARADERLGVTLRALRWRVCVNTRTVITRAVRQRRSRPQCRQNTTTYASKQQRTQHITTHQVDFDDGVASASRELVDERCLA
jgi:hypothetical protein